jgi:hypothetical protein
MMGYPADAHSSKVEMSLVGADGIIFGVEKGVDYY